MRRTSAWMGACLVVVPVMTAASQGPITAPAGGARSGVAAALIPPAIPMASEAATAGVTRFSFIVYGDTRGRHDGAEVQAEHELVVESMLNTIRRAASADPIRFVLQSGDAVHDGEIAAQYDVSYAPVVNRLMREGGVPLFLAVGNHDVGNATD